MKKFLMFIVMVCLVILLGFPKAVSAANWDVGFYRTLNRNRSAIGRAIPGLRRLDRYNGDSCFRTNDRALFCLYQRLNWLHGTKYIVSDVYDDGTLVSPERTSGGVMLDNDGTQSIEGLLFYRSPSPHYDRKYLGSYFTYPFPEFTILKATELAEDFGYQNTVAHQNKIEVIKGQKFQVDGTTAVVWEQEIPKNNSGPDAAPILHHVFFVENSSISDIGLAHDMRYTSRQFPNKPNYEYKNPSESRRIVVDREEKTWVQGVSLFDSFYYLIFASDAPLTQNVIENVVRSIVTGTPPAPYSPSPTVNPNFSFPTLKEYQTTNLPIDVSTAFNPSVNSWKYKILGGDLPIGLKYNEQTKTIIVDSTSLPLGPKNPPTVTGTVNYPVEITVLDNNQNPITSHIWNLTVNP